MEKWEPINYLGEWNYDPRGELLLRARLAIKANDTYVAVPVALAVACGNLRECKSRTILRGDEDGLFKTPIEIHCRKPADHLHRHSTGTVDWVEK